MKAEAPPLASGEAAHPAKNSDHGSPAKKDIRENVTAWLGLRNKAAHGQYGEYQKEQVALMISVEPHRRLHWWHRYALALSSVERTADISFDPQCGTWATAISATAAH